MFIWLLVGPEPRIFMGYVGCVTENVKMWVTKSQHGPLPVINHRLYWCFLSAHKLTQPRKESWIFATNLTSSLHYIVMKSACQSSSPQSLAILYEKQLIIHDLIRKRHKMHYTGAGSRLWSWIQIGGRRRGKYCLWLYVLVARASPRWWGVTPLDRQPLCFYFPHEFLPFSTISAPDERG